MGNTKEAEIIAPMFDGYIEKEDIVSLPPFTGYLKTLQSSDSTDTALMSFETLDYKSEFKEVHNNTELQELSDYSFNIYGDKTDSIMSRYLEKTNNPRGYFRIG